MNFPRSTLTATRIGHDVKESFHHLGQVAWVVERGFENAAEQALREQARVFCEEAEDDPIEKPRNAKIFLLGNCDFGMGFRILQLRCFRDPEASGRLRQSGVREFRDLGGSALRLEGIRVLEQGAENLPFFGWSISSLVNSWVSWTVPLKLVLTM